VQVRYIFKDIHHAGGAIRHVFPTHQKAVLDLIERLPDMVEEMWVFGSSITLQCGQGSDLDICLIGDVDPVDTKGLWVMDHIPIDLVVASHEQFNHNAEIQGSLFQRIKADGLKIWERGVGLS